MGNGAGAVEGVVMNDGFWQGKRVFLTGHTGFKGAWLSLLLRRLGAEVAGYALAPPTDPSLFVLARIGDLVSDRRGDVRDLPGLTNALAEFAPEIVIHMAAQPLVRAGYADPVETYATNVLGTVHLLESVRHCPGVRAVVNVTSDKCYEHPAKAGGCREGEPLGGDDPYSSSKACAELVTQAYRSAYFGVEQGTSLASVRAGNVIGGGDWAADRLVPDCVRALLAGQPLTVRNPQAVRPWQHVLDPLAGYLLLARRLYESGGNFAGAWNFGPAEPEPVTVSEILQRFGRAWGAEIAAELDGGDDAPPEAPMLTLDSTKARRDLGWEPRWSLDETLRRTVAWYRAHADGADMRDYSSRQIDNYLVAGR